MHDLCMNYVGFYKISFIIGLIILNGYNYNDHEPIVMNWSPSYNFLSIDLC